MLRCAQVLSGELRQPSFSERIVFKAIQSMEGGMGSPRRQMSDRELEVLQLSVGDSEPARSRRIALM